MSTWTWKQAVADEILYLVNQRNTLTFALDDLYTREAVLQERFPRNHHVREKIRQTLQRLRDLGFISFIAGAKYTLNLAYTELALEPAPVGETGIDIPETSTVVRTVRLRNTLLAGEIKRRYSNVCQICRTTVQLVDASYAESHHIQPLGSPHNGPDVEGNIVVVCPNHHIMFDRGAVDIDFSCRIVRHIRGAFEPREFFIQPWHQLEPRFLDYYARNILGKTSPDPPRRGPQGHAMRIP